MKQGDARAGALGGDRRSGRVEKNADVILAMLDAKPDITLAELQTGLVERGVTVSGSSIWRFFDRRRITLEKSAHADEQGSPDILKRRRTWFESRLDLARLLFLDETGATTRCPPAWPGSAR